MVETDTGEIRAWAMLIGKQKVAEEGVHHHLLAVDRRFVTQGRDCLLPLTRG